MIRYTNQIQSLMRAKSLSHRKHISCLFFGFGNTASTSQPKPIHLVMMASPRQSVLNPVELFCPSSVVVESMLIATAVFTKNICPIQVGRIQDAGNTIEWEGRILIYPTLRLSNHLCMGSSWSDESGGGSSTGGYKQTRTLGGRGAAWQIGYCYDLGD